MQVSGGKAFQVEETVSAKALRQKGAWWVCGTATKPVSTTSGYVTLGKSFSKPQCPHLQNGDMIPLYQD